MPGSPGTREVDPALRRATTAVAAAGARAPRDEQLVRLRRHRTAASSSDAARRGELRARSRGWPGRSGPGELARRRRRSPAPSPGARPDRASRSPPAARHSSGAAPAGACASRWRRGLRCDSRHPARDLATIFTSSTGDGDNLHAICEALACRDRGSRPRASTTRCTTRRPATGASRPASMRALRQRRRLRRELRRGPARGGVARGARPRSRCC